MALWSEYTGAWRVEAPVALEDLGVKSPLTINGERLPLRCAVYGLVKVKASLHNFRDIIQFPSWTNPLGMSISQSGLLLNVSCH